MDKIRRTDFCVSKKKRDQDSIVVDGERIVISTLIENNPLKLWAIIHTKGSKTSLVRTSYAKLKEAVAKIDPALIEKVNKEHEQYKARRKIAIELENGTLKTSKSHFRKLNP
jgi:hypothetical protein